MLLSDLITEVGYDSDRVNIDARIKFRLQQSIGTVYAALDKEERQRTATLTTVSGQQWVNAPGDFGDVVALYDSDKAEIPRLTPAEFFDHNNLSGSGTPLEYTYWNNQFLFSPVPDDIIAFTLNYEIEHPNIYEHNLNIDHQASMTGYLQVYIDEDGFSEGEGKLLFISPTATDARVWLQTVDGHRHEVIVYHDAAAANHPPWYFDEDATNAYERNFFNSPTISNTVIKTLNYRKHHHYLSFIHNPDPTTFPDGSNVAVYVDEDTVDRTLRLAFVSPTTTSGTDELVHTKEGEMPGLLERYHSVIFELTLAKMQRFNKNYEWAREHGAAAASVMALITGKPPTVIKEESRDE